MARFHDRSISGTVRYLGAKKEKGQVADDLVGKALKEVLNWKDEVRTVQAGAVIATHSGELAKTHGVKRIFHVAAVQGVPGGGYDPVPNIADCVWNALVEADEENANKPKKDRLLSILFPILGAGTAKGDVDKSLSKMIDTILVYFENNDSAVERAYLLTYGKEELVAASTMLDAIASKGRLTTPVEEDATP
jgi:O-acetyl-ADP-ribose deacetylase (regulator of RNase III)